MVIGIFIGILIGRRCQVSSALKDLLDAAKRAAAAAQAAGDDGAGDDEADAENEDEEAANDELLQVRPYIGDMSLQIVGDLVLLALLAAGTPQLAPSHAVINDAHRGPPQSISPTLCSCVVRRHSCRKSGSAVSTTTLRRNSIQS